MLNTVFVQVLATVALSYFFFSLIDDFVFGNNLGLAIDQNHTLGYAFITLVVFLSTMLVLLLTYGG